jgi:hypothetical protein
MKNIKEKNYNLLIIRSVNHPQLISNYIYDVSYFENIHAVIFSKNKKNKTK